MEAIKKEVTKTVTKEYDGEGKLTKEIEVTKEVEYVDRPNFGTPLWGDTTIKRDDRVVYTGDLK